MRAFHASATASAKDLQTEALIFRSGSGSSLVSQAEAARQAHENAQRNVAATLRAASGDRDSYAYAVDRQLDPLVETLSLPGGDPAAQVTVNSYGALIVNARSALFVDVDTRRDDEDAENYLRKSAPFASAAFTAEVGRAGPPAPELQLIVDYHDQWCAAHSGQPLA